LPDPVWPRNAPSAWLKGSLNGFVRPNTIVAFPVGAKIVPMDAPGPVPSAAAYEGTMPKILIQYPISGLGTAAPLSHRMSELSLASGLS